MRKKPKEIFDIILLRNFKYKLSNIYKIKILKKTFFSKFISNH